MLWQIRSFPKCRYHVFLSHSQEDRDGLVRPVAEGLTAAGVSPWLDEADYNYGRSSRESLQDAVLSARHVVFFVTDAMLQSARGWCVLELAYAEILDANLQGRGGKLAHAFLPLFLVGQDDPRLPRTVWQAVRDRRRFMPQGLAMSSEEWCRREIRDFLRREQRKCSEVNDSCRLDGRLTAEIEQTPGLLVRVTRFQPRRVS